MIKHIPATIWGDESHKAYLYVHGKMASKQSAEPFAQIADSKGFQTISFDLPRHGERLDSNETCDIWNGINNLTVISDFVFNKWIEVSLYGCSLGAFFSLHAYPQLPFVNCLFQSPILDMEHLIQKMFQWFQVTEEQLKQKGEIETPIDTLSWKYYTYVKEQPFTKWDIPTHILYGAKDTLQSIEVINQFVQTFHCELTVSKNSEHAFMGPDDLSVIEQWIEKSI